MDRNTESSAILDFGNGITFQHSYHIQIEFKEIHGIQLNDILTEWDINQFLKDTFKQSIYNLKIQYKDETVIDFYSCEKSVLEIVKSLDQRRCGMNGKNLIVSARFIKPTPIHQQIERYYGKSIEQQFDELPVGCRPDTIVLSNLPLNWFQLDNNHSIHSSHCLYHFLSQFGTIREISIMNSSPLCATVGIVFKTLHSFYQCFTSLQDRIIIKEGVKKVFVLEVSFDKTQYFSKESKRQKKEVEERKRHEEKRRIRHEKEEERNRKELVEKIQRKLKEMEEVIHPYLQWNNDEIERMIKEIEERRKQVNDMNSKQMKEFLFVISKVKHSIKHIGEDLQKAKTQQQLNEVNEDIRLIEERMKYYQKKTDEISELTWMERMKDQCLKSLQQIKKLSEEKKVKDFSINQALLNQLKEWTERLLQGQSCMNKIESSIETMEQPLSELRNELKDIINQHKQTVNSVFMTVNERCTNLQQMIDFEQVISSLIQQFNKHATTCLSLQQLQEKHTTITNSIQHEFKNVKNDSSTYENSISELKVALEKNIVECIQELTKQDYSEEIVSSKTTQIEKYIQIEEIFVDFLKWIEKVESFHSEFGLLQKKVHEVYQAIEEMKKTEASFSNELTENDIDALPEFGELDENEIQTIFEGIKRGTTMFKEQWNDPAFIDKMKAYFTHMTSLFNASHYFLTCKKEACENAKHILHSHANRIDKLKEKLVDRFITLENRKHCIEEELHILEIRRIRFLEKNHSIIHSEISKGPFSSLWSWSDKDLISPYYKEDDENNTQSIENEDTKDDISYKKDKQGSKVQFRFNPEKGCFEEITL